MAETSAGCGCSAAKETGEKAAVAMANATIIFFIFFSSTLLKILFTNPSSHQ